ncbi:hypothetical protein MMC17_006124 [Xylographa soralifera]|nr:hypothetical protein [Xylographa soralifera]
MPVVISIDYYAVLEVNQGATADEIKQAYRRLSLARHPDKNLNSPTAHHAFCTLNEAYETLGDGNRRVLYNAIYAGIRAKHASEAQERQQRESARAAAENVKTAADSARREREQWQDLQRKRAEVVQKERAGLTSVESEIQKLEMQVRSLEKTAKESLKADKQGDTWWEYFSGWGRTAEDVEKEKTKRQQEILQRLASERIKMAQLKRELDRFQQSKNSQLKIMRESELKFKVTEEKALREQHLREDAVRRKAAEESAREEAVRRKASEELAARMREEWRKQQEERTAKAKAAEKEWNESERLARERTREAARERLAAMMKREAAAKAEQEAETARQQERLRRTTPAWPDRHGTGEKKKPKPSKSSPCAHSGFWPKVAVPELPLLGLCFVQKGDIFKISPIGTEPSPSTLEVLLNDVGEGLAKFVERCIELEMRERMV